MRSSPSSAQLRSQPQASGAAAAFGPAGVRVPANSSTSREQHDRRHLLHPRSYYDEHLREGLEEADNDSDLEQGHYRPDARVRSEPDVDAEDEEDVESERGDLLGPPLSLMIEMNPLEADLQRRKRGARPAQQQQQQQQQPRARHAGGGWTGGRFPFRFLNRHPNGDSNARGLEPRQPPESRVDVLSPVRSSFGRKMKLRSGQTLDTFFERVYSYYTGKGYQCILLAKAANLLTLAFVVGFSTFLGSCVEYSQIKHSKHLKQILVPNCASRLPGLVVLVLVLFAVFWAWQALQIIQMLPELKEMQEFYNVALQISDQDIDTVAWKDVVNRLIAAKELLPAPGLGSSSSAGGGISSQTPPPLPSSNRLSAHDITNRIMRKENFMVALFNKDIFDLSIPVVPYLRRKQILTRTLEWNLSFCVLGYVFNRHGQIRRKLLRDMKREELAAGLRRRFIFMGFLNAIFAPFIVVYLLMFFFFRYFEEFYKNPSSIGSRQYSPFARWKFREFNELPHYFQQRLNRSYENAMKYMSQFPQEKTAIIARFLAFIAGSFAAVLVALTLYDQELLLGFELSPNHTVFFYISVFGAVLAAARSQIPAENEVFDPVRYLQLVVESTHYLPDEWRGRLHTEAVRREFGSMFEFKVLIFFRELLSVLATPWILWFSLPSCSEKLVDFFREFSVHVEGVGYVCSFAVFDFRRHGNARYGAPAVAGSESERLQSKYGKMEKSFVNFKINHPDWLPQDEAGSLYLSRLNDFSRQQRPKRPSELGRHGSEPEAGDLAASVANLDELHASLVLPPAQERTPPRQAQQQHAARLTPSFAARHTPPAAQAYPAPTRFADPALSSSSAGGDSGGSAASLTESASAARPRAHAGRTDGITIPSLYLSAAAADAARLRGSPPSQRELAAAAGHDLASGSSQQGLSGSAEGTGGAGSGREGMLALLNQFYDLNQPPRT